MVDFNKLFEADEEAALKNYAARLPVTEIAIDPQTGFQYNRQVVPELKLPVQGVNEYIAGSGDVRPPLQWFPTVQQGMENVKAISEEGSADWSTVKDRLFGSKQGKIVNSLSGKVKVEPDAPFAERFQLWPEKMVRSGINLPTDVMSGNVATGVGMRRGDYSDDPYAPQPLSHLIERTQDMAGLAAGGSIAATGLKAERPGLIARGAKALKDRLQEVFADEIHNVPTDVIGGVAEVRKSPNGKGWEVWNKDKNELWVKEEGEGMTKSAAQSQAETLNKEVSERAFRLNADNEAGTALSAGRNSLMTRMSETMPELLNRQRASEGYEAAIRDPETKKLYTGMWHEEVMDKMAKDKGISRDQLPDNIVKGYIDNNGRFLTEAQLEKRSQSKSAMFRSDDIVGTGLAAAAPRFYSHVENIIDNATMMVRNTEGKRVEVPQQKFNANELTAYLKNKGATAEEIEALGLTDFLQGKKSITKEELVNHIKENKVELEETVLGSRQDLIERARKLDQVGDHEGSKKLYAQMENMGNPRFAQYQLPNGENYRELLMSLKDNPKKVKRVEEINENIGDLELKKKQIYDEKINKPGSSQDVRKAAYDELKELDKQKIALAQERLDLEQSFSTEHWPNNKNVVVHARMNDRDIPVDSGPNSYTLKSLHAEEVQSDWLQKGNSEGFKLPKAMKDKLEPEFNKIDQKILKHAEDTKDESIVANPDLKDAIKTAIEKKIITKAEGDLYLRYSASENYGAVPDAPFKSGWSDLMIKRLIRQAAEENKDAVSWTPGQAQIDRYPGLQQHFDRVEYNPSTQEFKAYGKDGNITKKILSQSQLVDYIGKESTDKLINNPSSKKDVTKKKTVGETKTEEALRAIQEAIEGKPVAVKEGEKSYLHTLDNADLKVGGEFHKKFYDEIMVNKVNAIAKKFGGRVEESGLSKPAVNYSIRNVGGGTWEVYDNVNPKYNVAHKAETKEKAQDWVNSQKVHQPIWVLRLTPEMKKHALEKGFSMFETGLPLTPVDHDPWEKKKHKLIPIEGNPFQ